MAPQPSFNVEASNYQLLSPDCVQTDALCMYQQLTGTCYTTATSRARPTEPHTSPAWNLGWN